MMCEEDQCLCYFIVPCSSIYSSFTSIFHIFRKTENRLANSCSDMDGIDDGSVLNDNGAFLRHSLGPRRPMSGTIGDSTLIRAEVVIHFCTLDHLQPGTLLATDRPCECCK